MFVIWTYLPIYFLSKNFDATFGMFNVIELNIVCFKFIHDSRYIIWVHSMCPSSKWRFTPYQIFRLYVG